MKKVVLVVLCVQMAFPAAPVHAYGEPYAAPPAGYGMSSEARGARGPDIREQMHATEERIRRGLDRGLIDRREAHDLFGELREIRDRIERMRDRDRRPGPDERARIERDLDRLNRRIGRAMHDEGRRYDDGRR